MNYSLHSKTSKCAPYIQLHSKLEYSQSFFNVGVMFLNHRGNSKVIPVQVIPLLLLYALYRRSRGIALIFLDLSTRSRQVVTFMPSSFTPGEKTRYAKLGEPQSRSGCSEEDKNLLPLPGFEPQFAQPVASHSTD